MDARLFIYLAKMAIVIAVQVITAILYKVGYGAMLRRGDRAGWYIPAY